MAPNATNAKKTHQPSSTNEVEKSNSSCSEITKVLFETDIDPLDDDKLEGTIKSYAEPEMRKLQIVWRNVIAFGILHISALYGAWLLVTSAKWLTLFWVWLLYMFSELVPIVFGLVPFKILKIMK